MITRSDAIYKDDEEDRVWKSINPKDLWVFDKLILSRKLGYNCGPTGLDVPYAGWYMVRPCVNMIGLGLGAGKYYLKQDTTFLNPGTFWCEWFEGRHISIDYQWGKQILAVEGFKSKDTFMHWDDWVRVDDEMALPVILEDLSKRYEYINCEYIGNRLVEVHLRKNPDFEIAKNHFIPVWRGQDTTPPQGYQYIEYPEQHGRIGAFVK